MRSILSQQILTSLPGSHLRFFYRDANSVPTSTPFFYSSINRLYAENPVFEIVREESVKVCLHMHNGNVQQNPPCVESCVTKEISISPQLSPTMFDPDANSVLLRAHLCTAVDFMCRKPCVRNRSRERKGLYNNGNVILHTFVQQLYAQNPVFEIVHDESVKVYLHMYNGNVQRNPLCVESSSSCVPRCFPSFPGSRQRFFIAMQFQYFIQILAHLCTAVLSINRLYAQNPVFEIVPEESVKVYLQINVQRECSAKPSMRGILYH